MFKPSNFPQKGTEPALRPYIVPTMRMVPLSLENALLQTSANGGEIDPGYMDDWGDF
jgi:hypothetical protein